MPLHPYSLAETICGAPQEIWVVLVLLIGLPASGKSTWLASLEALYASQLKDADSAAASPTALRWISLETFRLDDFMERGLDSSSGKKGAAFSPERWKQASQEVFAAVERRWRELFVMPATGLQPTDTSRSALRLLVVEDNMHYRSMRERYWKLCRVLDAALEEEPSAMAEGRRAVLLPRLLELRLDVSLGECFRRNEGRRQQQAAGGYVDPTVIQSLHDRFEYCLLTREEEVGKNPQSDSVGAPPSLLARERAGYTVHPSASTECSRQPYYWVHTSCDWLVLSLRSTEDGMRTSSISAPERENGFDAEVQCFVYEVMPHADTLNRLRQQGAVLREGRLRTAAVDVVQQKRLSEGPHPETDSFFHRLDQQLRQAVGHFLRHSPAGQTRHLQQTVQQLKKAQMEHWHSSVPSDQIPLKAGKEEMCQWIDTHCIGPFRRELTHILAVEVESS